MYRIDREIGAERAEPLEWFASKRVATRALEEHAWKYRNPLEPQGRLDYNEHTGTDGELIGFTVVSVRTREPLYEYFLVWCGPYPHGEECPACGGKGEFTVPVDCGIEICSECGGSGAVEADEFADCPEPLEQCPPREA